MGSLSDKNNINPELWGPHFWNTLHLTTFAYPDNPNDADKLAYKNFYLSFGGALPCYNCSISCLNYTNGCDINSALMNRDSLIKWGFNLHNIVNEKLGKKYTVGYEKWKTNYVSSLDTVSRKSERFNLIVMIMSLVVIILLVIIVFKMHT